MQSESIKELAAALAKVRFGEIGKSKSVKVITKTGSSYSFDYAPMEVIMGAIRGPLAEQGLSLSQSVLSLGQNDRVVVTNLLHASGEWLSSQTPIIVGQKFDKDGKELAPTAQEMGSAITYARRYGVTLACCLVADEDDDANIADGSAVKEVKKETPNQIVEKNLAMEGMPPEVSKAIRDEATKIGVDFYTVSARAALASWNAFKATANESEIEACWQHIDSKVRAGIKKVGQAPEA